MAEACLAMATFADESKASQKNILALGGIELLIIVMDLLRNKHTVQVWRCCALGSIAYQNAQMQTRISEAGGILEEWTDQCIIAKTQIEIEGSKGTACAVGPLKERVYVSKEEMRECMLSCPCCLRRRLPNPGMFLRDACMLSFLSKDIDTNTMGTLFCTKVKVTEILDRPFFVSYSWGNNLSTQKIAKSLCEKIFLVSEMPYWLDIDGCMGFGNELVMEMRKGVTGCDMSNAFCNCINCLREFIYTCSNPKYIIPLLVSDHGDVNTNVGGSQSSGWSGQNEFGDEDWWKHAEQICQKNETPDIPGEQIMWSYLASFSPMDLRNEHFKDDGSLTENSDAENEIILQNFQPFFSVRSQVGPQLSTSCKIWKASLALFSMHFVEASCIHIRAIRECQLHFDYHLSQFLLTVVDLNLAGRK